MYKRNEYTENEESNILYKKEDYGDFYAEEIGKEYEENQSPEELAVPVGNEFTVDLQNWIRKMRATRREEISNYLIYIKKEKEIFTMRKVKRIKNVLCVLLATIISLVSMTTVKADGEVAPYEDMENATLLQKECYDLDEDTMIEITTYEKSIPSFARSSWKTKTGTRTYRIINKKSNTVFVRYILKGTFKYNGKSAQCTVHRCNYRMQSIGSKCIQCSYK